MPDAAFPTAYTAAHAEAITRVFATDGPLAQAISGYRYRQQQAEMAQQVAHALDAHSVLICEAGTGTGKTFAYLAPVLLAGGRVIISTGTKTLQDQLFEQDLPAVRAALGVSAQLALLKGRANYVCPYYLRRAQESGRLTSRAEVAHLRMIARFAKQTNSGDKAELDEVPEHSGAWRWATSTRENCLGQNCPELKNCFVAKARRQAQEADIVVVNHHLFFADIALRAEGVGELLPASNAVIFDEAHQIPEIAGQFFGEGIGTPQIADLCRDTLVEALSTARDQPDLQHACRALDKAVRDFRLAFGKEGARRLSAMQWDAHEKAPPALHDLSKQVATLETLLTAQAVRSEALANCLRRTTEIRMLLARWQQAGLGAASAAPVTDAATNDTEASALVRWAEITAHHVLLNLTPLSVAPAFRRQMEGRPRAWIFTSATLAAAGNFAHFQEALGLDHAATGCWGSPFPYEQNALLYCPKGLPVPSQTGYAAAVAEAAWPVIEAARGRAFVLCTTLAAMHTIHAKLQESLAVSGHEWPLLLQGESAKSQLLKRFRQSGHAILVASQSFWEGVDVRGEALSLVIIDKLPFAPPDDPVLAARIQRMKRSGRDPFREYQLPRTIINMKQGTGRLIRDEQDRGVLMICDPRLVDSNYGKRIWRALPPMRRSRDLRDVQAFFAAEPVESRHEYAV